MNELTSITYSVASISVPNLFKGMCPNQHMDLIRPGLISFQNPQAPTLLTQTCEAVAGRIIQCTVIHENFPCEQNHQHFCFRIGGFLFKEQLSSLSAYLPQHLPKYIEKAILLNPENLFHYAAVEEVLRLRFSIEIRDPLNYFVFQSDGRLTFPTHASVLYNTNQVPIVTIQMSEYWDDICFPTPEIYPWFYYVTVLNN